MFSELKAVMHNDMKNDSENMNYRHNLKKIKSNCVYLVLQYKDLYLIEKVMFFVYFQPAAFFHGLREVPQFQLRNWVRSMKKWYSQFGRLKATITNNGDRPNRCSWGWLGGNPCSKVNFPEVETVLAE